jgi:hypothetical protein
MAKKNTWHSLWGPISVLNNEADVRISHFPESRLDELKDCTDIFKIILEKPLQTVDLAKIAHLSTLREIKLDKCSLINEQLLLNLPYLHTIKLNNCKLSKEQTQFFDDLEDDFLNKNHDKVRVLGDALWQEKLGSDWRKPKSDEEKEQEKVLTDKARLAILEADWQYAFSQPARKHLREGISWLFHLSVNKELCIERIDTLLSCTDQDVFNLTVDQCLGNINSHNEKELTDLLIQNLDRLEQAFIWCFYKTLDVLIFGFCDAVFAKGKLKSEHFRMIKILKSAPAEKFINLYQVCLDDRVNFSDSHLTLYKRLLDIIAKSKAKELTQPIIELIQYEKQVPDGDLAFVKKCLKTVARLGDQSHLPDLESTMQNEQRPELLAEYEVTKTRLQKRSIK